MVDVQNLRFNEPLPRQPVEANEAPPVKRLDGEVTRLEEIAFAGGTYCEVWVGRWEKRGGEVGGEKVGLSFAVFVLLTFSLAGGLESTPDT